jgi:general secretion pathway protein I
MMAGKPAPPRGAGHPTHFKRGPAAVQMRRRGDVRLHRGDFSCVPASGQRAGFTLVEILVALAIIAVALAAGMRALAQATDSATLLKQRTLALWVAQNRVAVAQIESPWPALGPREGTAFEAGSAFAFRETISATPNPAFRKIEVVVSAPGAPDYALAQLVGFIGNAAAP